MLKRAKNFITCKGKFFGTDDQIQIKNQLLLENRIENATQLSLFSSAENTLSVLTGEL